MRFQAGQSGNPSGRPKVEGAIRDLARKHCKAAILRLVELSKSDNQRVAVTACSELLDRGFGRPPQAIQHSGADGGPLLVQIVDPTRRGTPL